MQQRSVILFHSAIKSDVTRTTYNHHLTRFLEYFIIKNFDSLLKISPKKTQEMIEDYVLHQRSRELSASHIKIAVCALELFYSMNDFILNFKKIKKMIPESKKSGNDKPYTTEHLKQMLNAFSTDRKYYALVHFMSASGIRAGAITELRLKDLDDMPNGCKSVKVYADTRAEYQTFIHQEAVTVLNNYLKSRTDNGEILNPDSWLFIKRGSNKPLTQSDITNRFAHTKFIFRKNRKGTKDLQYRHEIALVHGIRKRWNTVMKNNFNINPLMVEKMFGHTSKLIPLDSTYHKPSLDILFKEYQKAIPGLLIDESLRLGAEIEAKNHEIQELMKKDNEIKELKDTMQNMKNNLIELEKRMNPTR